MLLYLVRHGQSERNVTGSGPFDCPLTELGMKQAELTGEWLVGKGIETVYCSPSIRTLQTATIIARHIGVKPRAWGDIVEWGYLFDSPGLTGKQMRADFPDIEIDASYADDVPWIEHKTDESWAELAERAEAVLKSLKANHPEGSRVALITHAHFSRYLVAAAIGYKEVEGHGGVFQHANCAVTTLELKEDRTILWYLNAHQHLGDLKTD